MFIFVYLYIYIYTVYSGIMYFHISCILTTTCSDLFTNAFTNTLRNPGGWAVSVTYRRAQSAALQGVRKDARKGVRNGVRKGARNGVRMYKHSK